MSSFYLKDGCFLKRLEEPYIYDVVSDELCLPDEEAFGRILAMHSDGVRDKGAVDLLDEAGLLKDMARKLPVWTEGRSANPSLRYLEIQITSRCDKACCHCYLGAPVERDMHQGTFEAILDQFSRIQCLKVMVSGGEPAFQPRFKDMTETLLSRNLRVILMTHGEWIGQEEAALLGTRFQQVQISLDGLEAVHDALRGEGSFEKAFSGIEALRKKAGVPVSVVTMVHLRNLGDFERMSELIRILGVEEWSIDVPCPAGRWTVMSEDPAAVAAMSEKIRYTYSGGFHG